MGFLITRHNLNSYLIFLSRAGIHLQTLQKISSVLEKKKTNVLEVWNKCSNSIKEKKKKRKQREREKERQNFRTSDLPGWWGHWDRPKIQLEKLLKCNSTAIDTGYQSSNLCMSLEVLGHFVLPEGQRPATETLDPMSGWEGGLLGLQFQNRTLELHQDKLWQTGWVTCKQHRHAIHWWPVSNVKDGEMHWESYSHSQSMEKRMEVSHPEAQQRLSIIWNNQLDAKRVFYIKEWISGPVAVYSNKWHRMDLYGTYLDCSSKTHTQAASHRKGHQQQPPPAARPSSAFAVVSGLLSGHSIP